MNYTQRTIPERLYVDLKPISNGDDFNKLLVSVGSNFITDPLGSYINISKKRKPDDFDILYANILQNSRYDRKASDFVIKFNEYLVSLYEVLINSFYDDYESECVIKHIDSGRCFKINGNYNSHSDLDFHNQKWYEVEPVEVIVIEYKPKNE